MGAHGMVVEPDGSLHLNNAGWPTVRTWLFSVEQARLLDNWEPIGLRGTASESYRVEDLFVPEEFTGTREDPTLRREPGPLYAFPRFRDIHTVSQQIQSRDTHYETVGQTLLGNPPEVFL
jgi:hypothetical protein